MSIDIPIPQLYKEVNHITSHGIEGYHVEKKYFDPKKKDGFSCQTNKLKVKETKRGNYLEDEEKLHKIVPGPGKYKLEMPWPTKSKSLHKPPDRQTYIEELIKHEKKEKRPAPGHYKIFKSQKQLQAEKKKLAAQKVNISDRMTYLDNIQYQSTKTPGSGAYNPHKRVKTQYGKIKTNPQEWRKKHEKQSKKKPPKLPDMGTYNPVPSTYSLFDSIKKVKSGKNYLGKLQRFKTQASGSGIPPQKYGIIQQWRGKDVKKKERHGLESVSKGISKSVYYH